MVGDSQKLRFSVKMVLRKNSVKVILLQMGISIGGSTTISTIPRLNGRFLYTLKLWQSTDQQCKLQPESKMPKNK